MAQETESQSLLEIENLSVEYVTVRGTAKALRGVSLDLRRGETLGVVGESGSGKSTLGLAIMGLLQPPARVTSGEIVFEGSAISGLDDNKLRRLRGRRVAMIFQDPMTSLNPVKKISDHFIEYIRTHDQSVSPKEAMQRAATIMHDLGMPPARMTDYPHQFSGGMRQRVMIGLALALNPSLIIADEPTTALDVVVEAQILELLRSLKAKYSLSVILITHNMGIIAEMSDRIAVMYAGRLAEVAPAMALFDNPRHPYTRALLQSIPTIDTAKESLKVVPGFPPDLTTLTGGCAFSPRCPYSFDRCVTEDPELVETGTDAKAACHLLTRKGET